MSGIEYQPGDCVRCVKELWPDALEGREYVVSRIMEGCPSVSDGKPFIVLVGSSVALRQSRFSPVHPSEVGQRVRVIDASGDSRATVGDVATVTDVRYPKTGSERRTFILARCEDGRTEYCQFAECFIVISDASPRIEPGTSDSCVNTTSPTVCDASMSTEDSQEPAAEPEDETVRCPCPWCGNRMFADQWKPGECFASCTSCEAMGPSAESPEAAIAAARQLHQDGPFMWGQEVMYRGEKLLYCCVSPVPKSGEWAILIDRSGHNSQAKISELRPVPAPEPERVYTKDDLPAIEGCKWIHRVQKTKDGNDVEFRFDALDEVSGTLAVSGRWQEDEDLAVRDILERIGGAFAKAAADGKDESK